MADESSGFFGRWSRRKAQAREGQPLNEPERIKPPWVPDANTRQVAAPQPTQDAVESPAQSAIADLPPAPTLEDAQALTQDSNFKPFMTQQVQPEVRNAAMKKLFSDPHFNVMDGLDVYIEDYSKPDPMPEAVLRQLASAQFLKLFDDTPESNKAATLREFDGNTTTQTVAQSHVSPVAPLPAHDHPYLRLQPDHATQPPGTGGSAE